MKTDWGALAKKLGVLRNDGSELYTGHHSAEALEEILGEEFIHHAVDTFIAGSKGNELAIKTIRSLRSKKAADYAYKIFLENKNKDTQKASLAVWAMSNIQHPVCMQYANEFLGDERYAVQTVALIKELVFNCYQDFSPAELDTILQKATAVKNNNAKEMIQILRNFLIQENYLEDGNK